jgi:hypothetical protein
MCVGFVMHFINRCYDIYNWCREIFNSFYIVTKSNVALHKLDPITTDVAKSRRGKDFGFIFVCRQHDDFPDFLYYQGNIHY